MITKLLETDNTTIFWDFSTMFVVVTKGSYRVFHARTKGSAERALLIAERHIK